MMARFSNDDSSSASFKNKSNWDLSGGAVIKIPHSQCWGRGSIPGPETKILQVTWGGQKLNK